MAGDWNRRGLRGPKDVLRDAARRDRGGVAEVARVSWKLCPEIVSAAESFAEQVIYIPVSATADSPEVDPKSGLFGIRPRDIDPMWAEVPLLYVLSRWLEGLVPYGQPIAACVAASMLPTLARIRSQRRDREPPAGPVPRMQRREGPSREFGTHLHFSAEGAQAWQPRFLHGGDDARNAAATGRSTGIAERLPAHFPSSQDPQAALNPVVHSHLRISVGGRNYHLLSRGCGRGAGL